MRQSFFACLLFAASVGPLAGAEQALVVPAPFSGLAAPGSLSSPLSAGSVESRMLSAERALASGFPSIAVDLYEDVLGSASVAVSEESSLRLLYVTALMEDGQLDKARLVLDAMPGNRNAAWRLRSALLRMKQRRADLARSDVAGLKVEDFATGDRPWFYFLQGLLADAAGNLDLGRDNYNKAISVAESSLSVTRFTLAREQGFLWRGVANLDLAKANYEKHQGMKLGIASGRQYAIGLNSVGRKGEAISVLQRLLQSLPASEYGDLDEIRLLVGLVDGAGPGSVGRNALFRLLEEGRDEERQRMALQLLSLASDKGLPLDEFKARLDTLIARQPAHPLLESLYYYRAEVALLLGTDEDAVSNARLLIDRFPASSLRVQALGVMVNAAWDRGRYRSAADHAKSAREATTNPVFAARLGVLVAEAWYRAGDYRNAADAYAAVMRTPPPGVSAGALMFQRIQSEIDAGTDLSAAQAKLDELGRDPAFDKDNRWQAEWNLARALQAARQEKAAYARVSNLLLPTSPLPADKALRARMALLEVQLALDSGEPAQAIAKASGLKEVFEPLDPALRSELAGAASLVTAQAEFLLQRPNEALAALERLRVASPGSPAAVYSIITEADYYIRQNRPVDAQRRLIALYEQYPKSKYAEYAIYRAALLVEQGGQESDYDRANSLLEQLIRDRPNSDLLFYARLRQGAIFAKLNRFPLAQRSFDYLVSHYPNHGDVVSAMMALADCHMAQANAGSNHADQAIQLYEELVAHPLAGPDLRVEAGYKFGVGLRGRGEVARAAEVWSRDVVDGQLLNEKNAAQLGASGRYWIARTLLDLSKLLETRGRMDEARRALRLMADSEVTADFAELARSRLSELPALTLPVSK